MKIYNQNATSLLFEKVKSLTHAHDSWRAIYFNFSDNQDQYSDGLRTHFVVKIIKELLADHEGNVYLCEDQDIVLLFQGPIRPIIAKLGEHFEGLKNQQVTIQPADELFTIFDLSQHWQIFFNLCKAKALQANPVPAAPSAPAPATPVIAAVAAPTITEDDMEVFNQAATKRPQRKRLSVLVVEDDVFTRKLVTSTIKDQFDVVEAGSGKEALDAYVLHAPDLVFLDIELPDINGQLILQKLIGLDRAAFIVMLSASSFKENILAALEVGAQGFVTKPFAKEKLMHYLKLRNNMRQDFSNPSSTTSSPSQETRV